MKFLNLSKYITLLTLSWLSLLCAEDQTPDLSPIFPETSLPFRVRIELADFALPSGLTNFESAVYEGKWLFLAGRIAGMHVFTPGENLLPANQQNTTLFVVDPKNKTVVTRSLLDPTSGLTQDQIDSLSVTAVQSYQKGRTLYLAGGFGFRTLINDFTTFNTLTAIDVPGLIKWVTRRTKKPAAAFIRQTFNDNLKVTGGFMDQLGEENPTLLVFGQDFEGAFNSPFLNGVYPRQVRRFNILDHHRELAIELETPIPQTPEPIFRRRDLNVVPIIHFYKDEIIRQLIVLSGGFTPTNGTWTVPVFVSTNGTPYMPDPRSPFSFKQGMNNYECAHLDLFSKRTNEMFIVLFGGLSLEFFENGVFIRDSKLPFINQVTTLKIDQFSNVSQYLMSAEYPVILSSQVNPGNPLLFGTSARLFLANEQIPHYLEHIVKLDALKEPLVVGYIVGGIASTAPQPQRGESAASNLIFSVILDPLVVDDSSSH